MNLRLSKICALVLLLAMTPGAFEIMENVSHLLMDGHFAHAEAQGDQHQPTGPEHGCTPIFHSCSCHFSRTCFGPPKVPEINLFGTDMLSLSILARQSSGFRLAIDRPPQV